MNNLHRKHINWIQSLSYINYFSIFKKNYDLLFNFKLKLKRYNVLIISHLNMLIYLKKNYNEYSLNLNSKSFILKVSIPNNS